MNFPTPSAESGIPAAFLTMSTPSPQRNASTATSAAGAATVLTRSRRAIGVVGATGVPPQGRGWLRGPAARDGSPQRRYWTREAKPRSRDVLSSAADIRLGDGHIA